ncbi:hypothetical protein [Kribbella sp. NPDC023855]|uniref:hypothetical protein n=1 Tax=Kribbella sp. NPDC023855 TaxID=3154698 RepID=UPI0033E4CC41
MEITEEMLSSIPPGNVRVPVDEFGSFWRKAESERRRLVLATPIDQTPWELSYASAVMKTVRWLAGAEVPMGPSFAPIWKPAAAPLVPYSGELLGRADREAIQAAYEESGRLAAKFPDGYETAGMPPRPGYLEGVRAALGWACFHGPAPRLEVHQHDSSPA